MAIAKNGAMNMVIQISVSLLSVILGIHSEEKFLATVLIILFLILLGFFGTGDNIFQSAAPLYTLPENGRLSQCSFNFIKPRY